MHAVPGGTCWPFRCAGTKDPRHGDIPEPGRQASSYSRVCICGSVEFCCDIFVFLLGCHVGSFQRSMTFALKWKMKMLSKQEGG